MIDPVESRIVSCVETEPEVSTRRASEPTDVTEDVRPTATRWTHVCAWDGHELEEMDHVKVSAHERVCRFHLPQFQTWCQETSQRRYRAEGGDVDVSEERPRPVPASS